jgi:hypothetical protein
MELTEQQLEIIRTASREIDFGRITINFVGSPPKSGRNNTGKTHLIPAWSGTVPNGAGY